MATVKHDEDFDRYIECECGKHIYLYGYSDTWQCECGRLYNNFGQELADPCFWGEEFDGYGIDADHEGLYV